MPIPKGIKLGFLSAGVMLAFNVVAATPSEINNTQLKGLEDSAGAWPSISDTRIIVATTSLGALAQTGIKGHACAKEISWLGNANVANIDILAQQNK